MAETQQNNIKTVENRSKNVMVWNEETRFKFI